MEKIPVRLKGKGYEVRVAEGLLRQAGREVRRLLLNKGSKVFVVTSPNVTRHWGGLLEQSLREARLNYRFLEMNDGEPAKRLGRLEALAEEMVRSGADRGSLVLAFGGGVVGDSAGFLASIFMRGVPVIQVPTTVVAQLDASIGGKTGVNLESGKNLLGTFHQPLTVLVDPAVLETLPEREYRSGLFEAIKCGVIRDSALFSFMEEQRDRVLAHSRKPLQRVLSDSIRVKAAVVAADERESDLRRVLNFGHTIGHALEAATDYTYFLHGEAVAWGMIAACGIAKQVKTCRPEVLERIISLVRAYGPLPPVACLPRSVLVRLGADKKAVGGVPYFVLPQKRIGKVAIRQVPPDAVREAVEAICSHE